MVAWAYRLAKWRAIWRALRLQMAKRHGAGRPPLRQAWFMARCAGYVAGGQHLRQRGPHYRALRGFLPSFSQKNR